MKIFVTRRIPEAGLDMLKDGADIEIWPGPEDAGPSKVEVIAGAKKADLVLSRVPSLVRCRPCTVCRSNPQHLPPKPTEGG